MRITAFILLISSLAPSYLAADQPLPTAAKADSVLVLKKERTFTLMRQGKVLKTYKVALGPEPVGPKQRQGGTIRLLKESTSWIAETPTASSIAQFTSPIQARRIATGLESWEFHLAATSMFMGCQTDMLGWELATGSKIGPTAVLP